MTTIREYAANLRLTADALDLLAEDWTIWRNEVGNAVVIEGSFADRDSGPWYGYIDRLTGELIPFGKDEPQ